jgi:para-aminobenzoate synthetase component 1
MWSDRTPPEQLSTLVAKLQAVLCAPKPGTSPIRHTLSGKASLEQLTERLHFEPGFACFSATVFRKPLLTIAYSNGTARVCGAAGATTLEGRGFDILSAMLHAWRGPSGAVLAGFLAYDLAAEIEDLGPAPVQDFVFPSFHFGLFDSTLTSLDGTWTLSGTDDWRPLAIHEAEDLLRDAGAQPIHAAAAPKFSGAIRSRPDRITFEAAVERIVATIHAGDIFQTNLCRCIETQLEPGSEWELFQRMRSINPSRYEAFLRIGDGQAILSTSPEQFLKVDGDIVESSPIKGTRPRACSLAEDSALASELRASGKDRAELAMIVDVVRNDLARVCRPGSVKVIEHASLMTLPTVHHLVSTVRGRFNDGTGPVDLLRAAFPAASITGAPKIEAMRAAMREERQLRGPCMGAIGWISLDGNMELSVAIRTAFCTGGRIRYYAGCGITADSVPAVEFVESRHKAAAFVRALGAEHDPNW